MHVHVLQHVPFEGLGSIATWLAGRQATVSWTRFFAAEALPALDAVDFLIALGGPMSVNDEDELPWLKDEKRFVRDAVAAGKPVLGICLGAQLIASALGARVYPGAEKEIGWFPVYAEAVAGDSFPFPATVEVLHWHGETFDLPAKAIHLASSAACRHQAFQYGPRVLGLQFHLEMTPESVAAIVANCRHELRPQRFVQSERELLATPPAAYQTINVLMDEVLDYLTRSKD